MTAEERLDEIAEILAAGLIRLRARKSSSISRDRGESSLDCLAHQSGHASVQDLLGGRLMTASVIARVAALKTTPTPALKTMWRDLFDSEPPPYNRSFLESRLAYRIQELSFGGLKAETIERLAAMADEINQSEGKGSKRRGRLQNRPIAGTRLIREWQGVEHCVTVRDHDFEYHGRPYKSLSAIAREITGTRWNGLIFFGIKNQRARP